ncbi:hypothetical protein D3C80_688030 [compost metagenome]
MLAQGGRHPRHAGGVGPRGRHSSGAVRRLPAGRLHGRHDGGDVQAVRHHGGGVGGHLRPGGADPVAGPVRRAAEGGPSQAGPLLRLVQQRLRWPDPPLRARGGLPQPPGRGGVHHHRADPGLHLRPADEGAGGAGAERRSGLPALRHHVAGRGRPHPHPGGGERLRPHGDGQPQHQGRHHLLGL